MLQSASLLLVFQLKLEDANESVLKEQEIKLIVLNLGTLSFAS